MAGPRGTRLGPGASCLRCASEQGDRYVRGVHGVPDDFDYSVFAGATLARVCFGAYAVELDFSPSEGPDPLSVTLEGAYVHAGPQAEGWCDEVRLPTESSRLMQLTNHRVTQAARLDSSRMKLDFDHGHSLTLVDDTDQYESFQIHARGQVWVI